MSSQNIDTTIALPDGRVVELKGTLSVTGSGPTPTPTPSPGNIGPDGVKQIYPDAQGGTSFYMSMGGDHRIPGKGTTSPNAQCNISYGSGSNLPSTLKTDTNGLKYYNTTASVVKYASGSPDSRSLRLDIYPDGGKWANKTTFAWNSKPVPDHLYTDKGIRNCEHTVYIRVNAPKLGTHASCAHKIGGRDQDDIRSLIEICHADVEHSNPYGHWNYAHFPYIATPITIVNKNFVKMQPGKWLGSKAVRKVADDRKSEIVELWQDPDPFDANGKPKNNWIKIAEIHDNGTSQYGNQACVWKSHKDVFRVDGYTSFDFCLASDREIDPHSTATVSMSLEAPTQLDIDTVEKDNLDGDDIQGGNQ
jgi:hypothetical protein